VIERLAAETPAVISIDTSDPQVMRAAVAAGAGMINDIRALRAPGALAMAATLGVPVVLMHMQGEPQTMQQQPQYQDVVAEVRAFLRARIAAAEAAGLARAQLLIDPGFGFGKSLAHNLRLLEQLQQFTSLQRPILVGLSRKSMLGAVTGAGVDERLPAGLAAAVLAVERGASLVRTHEVAATLQALAVVAAVHRAA
jgi:dihydropteroate synthase